MSYTRKIEQSKQKVYNQSIAQRILNLIDKLRLTANENYERRWIWELMQNAKDVAFDSQPVSILINFQPEQTEPTIEFKHTGKPFTIDNITFLIEQVSTKERQAKEGQRITNTGKFGTGFLTTHLLSEKVELESVAKEPDLPYKKFHLSIDRSGREIDEIIDSVNDSLKILSSLDEKETFVDFDKNEFNTTFRYILDDNGLNTAKKGLEDLTVSLPYALAFVPSIQSVSINSEIEYEILPETIVFNNEIEIHTIQKKVNGNINECYIAVLSNKRVSIAIEVDYTQQKITLKKHNPKLPKLFCDFPLIGSEDFNSPVIVNSPYFNPTESRDGIFLADKSDNKIVENKMLMQEAKELYFKLLDFAAQNNWDNMYVLADIDLPKPKDWISREWMKESIVNPIRNKLLKTPIIDTTTFGRIPIECGGFNKFLNPNAIIDFPKHKNKEILKKLHKLCDSQYFIIPIESDFQEWAEIIWDKKYEVSLQSIVLFIEKRENLSNLSEKLGKNISETIDWLNMFYALLIEEKELIKDISQNKIYPNQNGAFKKKEELYFEAEDIPEILKDIVNDLEDDFRNKLADRAVNIVLPLNNGINLSTIANQITKLIRPLLQELKRTDDTRKIFKHLYFWLNKNKKVADKIFGSLYENKHKLLDDNEIINSLEKADTYDELLSAEPNLSKERIEELLEIEELSKGFSVEKKYNPDERQKRINFENGWKGEAFVYKTLIEQGMDVNWPNKSTIETANKIIDYKGETHYITDKGDKYDLVISFPDNKKSFVQVKSTSTDISRANEIAMPISVREWKFINKKSVEDSYYLARVFNVSTKPEVYFMRIENKI